VIGMMTVIGTSGCADMITYSRDSERHGQQLYNEGQYAEAAGAYKNAARQNPRDYKAYYMMGNCYVRMNQWVQAIGAYRRSLEVQNVTLLGQTDEVQRMNTLTGLAGAIAKSDTRDIETNAAVSKARSSQNAQEYLLLAKIYAFRGDADSAIEAFDHATLLEPDNFYAAKEYGLYLEQLGQTPRAEAALRRAYALDPKDDQVNLALRRIGVVPGPSLKAERDLVGPPVPKGPIPEWNIGGRNAQQPASPPPGQTVQAPRD
jgi:cytochrome c-type biogenesis protein CcmH/NrfG